MRPKYPKCPITQRPFDCMNCKGPLDKECPYVKFDEAIEYTLEYIKELTKKERKNE